jgi:hypothetical protein
MYGLPFDPLTQAQQEGCGKNEWAGRLQTIPIARTATMKNFSKKKATMRNDEERSGQVAQLPTRGSFIY